MQFAILIKKENESHPNAVEGDWDQREFAQLKRLARRFYESGIREIGFRIMNIT